MKEIPDASVDLILTDPPYGTTACKWDSVIPFAPMWEQIKRVRKPNAAICLFGSEPFSSALRMSNIKEFKYDWVWEKNKNLSPNFVQAKNSPLKITENIVVFSCGAIYHEGKTNRRMRYNPQGLVDCNVVTKRSGKLSDYNIGVHRSSHGAYVRNKKNYPVNIIRYKFSSHENGNRLHPTQKPIALLEWLIKTYTFEGETVLDFAMGSGSTGVAAKNLSRKFIGIERDEKYFEVAKNRIESAQAVVA